jgi:predicted nucleotidyltransferase
MDYNLYLNNGQVITLTGATFNVVEFTKTLNSRDVTFVSIGGAIVNKNLIGSITPADSVVTNE